MYCGRTELTFALVHLPFASQKVERIGRIMNLTKNDLRTALGDERFFALCFIKQAMPSLEAVDW